MQNEQLPAGLAVQPSPLMKKKRRWPFILAGALVVAAAAVGVFYGLHQLPIAKTTPKKDTTPSVHPLAAASLSSAYDTLGKAGVQEFTAENKQVVLAAYTDLATGFSFTNNFPANSTEQLHSLGIAYLYHMHPEKKALYRDELYLLAEQYLDTLPAGITDATFEPAGASDTAASTVLLGYRDADLSTKVEQSAQFKTALDTAVKNLHITDTTKLSAYKIVAYNFNTSDAQFTELTKKHNLYGARPMMWVERVGDVEYIMMMKDYAQDVIDGKKNSLTHEFIHTQQAFVYGETGHTLEERRAEYFSGDESAYYDVKQLFIYMKVLGGVDSLKLLDAHPTDATAFYLEIYGRLGVVGGNALAFSWPQAYLGSATGAMQTVASENNPDIVVQQAVALGKKDPAAMNDRIKTRFTTLVGAVGSKEKATEHMQSLGETYSLPTAQTQCVDVLRGQGTL